MYTLFLQEKNRKREREREVSGRDEASMESLESLAKIGRICKNARSCSIVSGTISGESARRWSE